MAIAALDPVPTKEIPTSQDHDVINQIAPASSAAPQPNSTPGAPTGWEKYQSQPAGNPLFTLPAQPETEVLQAGTVTLKSDVPPASQKFEKTIPAQGITPQQLQAAVFDVAHYNKSELKLESCEIVGYVDGNPIVHMAVDMGPYEVQWMIALLPPVTTANGFECRWYLVPQDQVAKVGQKAVDKVAAFDGFYYYQYNIGGWILKDDKLTYWVNYDTTGLPGFIAEIGANQGAKTNLEEMIKSALTK